MAQRGNSPNRQMLPKKHTKFYFEEKMVTIQVEDTLFNVHKSQLLKSETFSDMFSLSNAEDPAVAEGSESHPIKLSGVSASDFENLLTVLYAYHFSDNIPALEATLLVPALRLANMWNFGALRAHLIPFTAAVLNDVDKIVYAREFGVSEWLGPAHIALCQRLSPPDIEESNKLGFQSVMVIYHLREKARSSSTQPHNSYCGFCYTSHPCSGTQTSTSVDSSIITSGVKTWIDSNFERLA